MKKYKIIAIIPARGGSKRLPRKNIKLFSGKPLIAYTIEAALKSKYLDRTVVSTDNKEIAEISKRHGAEIIERPQKLATDKAKVMDAIFHALDFLKKKNYIPDLVMLLQPTSPLRRVNDIDKAIEIFLKNKCHSVVGVYEAASSIFWSLKTEKKYLKPFFGWDKFFARSQDLPKVYIPNGAIYISTPEILSKRPSFYSKKTLPYIMPPGRSIDIDNESDFLAAEKLMNNQ